MEKRQVNEEERRQFLPEMDLEPVAWVALLFFFWCWFRLCCVFLFQTHGQSKIESFGWKMMKVDATNIQIPLFELAKNAFKGGIGLDVVLRISRRPLDLP